MKKFLFILTTGFALFSMFFGAGNLVFPLSLGVNAQGNCLIAGAGFSITAVLVPLLGFISMMLFDGDFRAFFGMIGKRSGFVLITLILALLCPFGAIPRCIALTYASFHELFPGLSIELFSLIACLVIFGMTIRAKSIISLLGKVLTPLLLITLGLILGVGLFSEHTVSLTSENSSALFKGGLVGGYQTLDLLAALFFSALLYPALAAYGKEAIPTLALKVSLIAATLLATTYIGFCYLAQAHGAHFQGAPQELVLILLSGHLLGSAGAIVTLILVTLACLTTAIALSAIFAEFVRKDLLQEKASYGVSLGITLVIAYFIAILSFNGIAAILAPILVVCYPALIFLCLVNMCHKLFGFAYVKSSFFIALFVAVGMAYFS